MKQLFKSGNATTLFFSDESSTEAIADWINMRLINGDNFLGLNEEYSCCAEKLNDKRILITGDEDMVEIEIEIVSIINL